MMTRAEKEKACNPMTTKSEQRVLMTHDEWVAEASRRFGSDPMNWRFVCPSCGHVAAVADWKAAGAPEYAVAFSCVGRWAGGGASQAFTGQVGPCCYAGGGLFRLNPVTVEKDGKTINVFAFAEADGVATSSHETAEVARLSRSEGTENQ